MNKLIHISSRDLSGIKTVRTPPGIRRKVDLASLRDHPGSIRGRLGQTGFLEPVGTDLGHFVGFNHQAEPMCLVSNECDSLRLTDT